MNTTKELVKDKRGRKKGEFHPGSKTEKMWNGIQSGLKLTAVQWQKRLDFNSKNEVYSTAGLLRKMGYLVGVVGKKHNSGIGMGDSKGGLFVDLTKNQEYFNEVFDRNQRTYVIPSAVNTFKALEIQANANPIAAKEIRIMAFGLYKKLLEIGSESEKI